MTRLPTPCHKAEIRNGSCFVVWAGVAVGSVGQEVELLGLAPESVRVSKNATARP
jgi:hypothetical protein